MQETNMATLELIATIASLVGVAAGAVALIRARQRKAKQTTIASIEGERSRLREAILQAGLHRQALVQLYATPRIASAGLEHYVARHGGNSITPGVVGRSNELRLEKAFPGPLSARLRFGNYDLERSEERPNAAESREGEDTLRRLRSSGIRVDDRPLYRLTGCDVTADKWSWKFKMGRYAQWRTSVGGLSDELMQALIDADNDVELLVIERTERLPLREAMLPADSSLAQPSSRCCAGGIGMVTAIYRAETDDFAIPVCLRSRFMGSGAGMLGIVPQGFHQHGIDPVAETSLLLTAYRELFEEMFGGLEVEGGDRHLVPTWFLDSDDYPGMKWFTDHEHDLVCTGIGTDLTAGTYDVSMLLAIRDPQFLKAFGSTFKLNWEFIMKDKPFVSSRDSGTIHRLANAPAWPPSSLFAFLRGLAVLRKLYPDQCDFPELEA